MMVMLKMIDTTDLQILRSFIGLWNYYCIYVQEFSPIAYTFDALLKENITWILCKNCQQAFNLLKQKLVEHSVLRKLEFSKDFILHTIK